MENLDAATLAETAVQLDLFRSKLSDFHRRRLARCCDLILDADVLTMVLKNDDPIASVWFSRNIDLLNDLTAAVLGRRLNVMSNGEVIQVLY